MAKLKQVSAMPYHEYRVGLLQEEANRIAAVWERVGTSDVTIQQLLRSVILLWLEQTDKDQTGK